MSDLFPRVGVVARRDSASARQVAREVGEWLARRGHQAILDRSVEGATTPPIGFLKRSTGCTPTGTGGSVLPGSGRQVPS